MTPILDIQKLALACIGDITKTLITDQKTYNAQAFKLDKYQLMLLKTDASYVRVVAPAGSGKTRTLTAKAIDILEKDSMARVLCLTYTNAAVHEFRDRIQGSPHAKGRDLKVATVNSFGFDVIRGAGEVIDTIDPASPKPKVRKIIKELLSKSPGIAVSKPSHENILGFSEITQGLSFWHEDTPDKLAATYDAAIHLGFKPLIESWLEQLGIAQGSSQYAFLNIWLPFWKILVAELWEEHLITFEGQKYWARYLLAGDLPTQSRMKSRRYTHIMVDEFQDINCLDLLLIAQIASLTNTCVYMVGDDDQCIFEWRGSTSHFLIRPNMVVSLFGKRADKFETIVLEQNYRSPRNIVEHSSKLIANNTQRVPKNIRAMRSDDANIRVVQTPAAYLSLSIVTELISTVHKMYPNHTVAVLSRKKCQLVPLQILLSRKKVPFYVSRDLNVFLAPAFADFRNIMALFNQKTADTETKQTIVSLFTLLDRVFREPINAQERAEITSYLQRHLPTTLTQAVDHFARFTGNLKRGYGKPQKTAEKMTEFLTAQTVLEALQAINTEFVGFQQDFLKSKTDIFFSDPSLSFLTDIALGYDKDFAGFVNDLDLTTVKAEAQSAEPKNVELTTALRAKGREFDTVILLDVVNKIWPHSKAINEGQIEEERRLFYVAVTRAKSNLLLFVNATIQGEIFPPSPFLKELCLPEEAWIIDRRTDVLFPQLVSALKTEAKEHSSSIIV